MNAKNKKAIPISIGMAVAVIMIVSICMFAVAIPGIASGPLNVTIKEQEQEPEKIEIEKLQQLVYDQGYNYTVAENGITALSPEERQSLCGYKPLTTPAGPLPLPENVKFQSKSMVEIHGSERNGQPPVGQPPAYDAMALGYVTPVKAQGDCGSCWIFGATTEFESDVLINKEADNLTLDYSEQEVGDCNIWSSVGGYNFCSGGNELMTTNYFTKHGAANESCHPYAATKQTCLNCPIHKNVDNWRMITGSNGDDLGQVNTIKNAILNYGPVYSTIYAGGPFGSYYNGVYEYWEPGGVNHAIEIIGWDDSLPHSHGTGAWMIKNSWGTGWGAGHKYPGCAWVAYGAANLGDYTSAITSYKNPGDVLFYHDECGWMGGCLGYPPSPTAYGAVRFTPSQNATLTAVDFWAVYPSMTYEIKIFGILNDLGGGTYTFSNQLGTTQTGSTTEMGYYSIPLNTPVQLINGDDFIVLVKLTTTTGWGYPLPIDFYNEFSHPWDPPLPQVFTFSGESYKSPDGSQFVKPTVDIGIRARALSGEPDLKITDKLETWLNMTHYNITYTVKSIGGANATNVSRTNITIDSVEKETDTVPALNASETHTATFGPFKMSGDNDTIRICADIDGNVTESNEDNNCLENTLHKSTTIEVNTSGWLVSPVEGDSAEGEFHNTTTPIQDAIYNASAGYTIIVHDGTYSENIVVDKELTIKAASSPIIDGLYSLTNPAFNITVNNVTVQGFIVQNFIAKGADAAGDTGAILVEGDNAIVVSNIVRNINCTGTEGVCPAGLGIDVHANDVEITNNQVYNISSTGIRVRHDWNTPPTVSNNILVENNTVYRTNKSSVLITGYAKGVTIRNNEIYESLEPMPYNLFVHYGASDVTIGGEGKGNYIHDAHANLVLAGCNNVTIKDNTIEDATSLPSEPSVKGKNIYILNDYRPWYDANALSTNITIESNNICNAEGWGVRIRNIGATDPSRIATTTTINWNNIVGNTEYGVENVNISAAAVNATHNWWNDTCGPGPVGPGSGDNVSDNVTYTPWLDAPYPDGKPVESCARVYFEPQNSSALYCHTKGVEIWVNATGYFQSGQINLTYNSSCANVTVWTLNTPNFVFGGGWAHKNGSDRISFLGNTSQTGKCMIGTLTIHCVSGSEKGCNTTLNFGDRSELFDDYGKTLPVVWINGTFSCEEISCGDVNCDYAINVGDATLTLNHWTSAGKYLLCSDWAGDVNCDGEVNVGDATLILNRWLNPSAYPLNCGSV